MTRFACGSLARSRVAKVVFLGSLDVEFRFDVNQLLRPFPTALLQVSLAFLEGLVHPIGQRAVLVALVFTKHLREFPSWLVFRRAYQTCFAHWPQQGRQC